MLEIWIKKARFDPTLVDGCVFTLVCTCVFFVLKRGFFATSRRRVSTFVLIDFFDFESQPTKLHAGLLPNYNLATTFKVRMRVKGFRTRVYMACLVAPSYIPLFVACV